MQDTAYNRAIQKLLNAKVVVTLTGAGISKESGIPTFRGEDGLWNKLSPEELTNFDAFFRNPALVTEWYKFRRQVINDTTPNPGHEALTQLARLVPRFELVTQNVDGLHQATGYDDVIELHGNIMRNRCLDCHKTYDFGSFEKRYHDAADGIPRCVCGGLIRPDVVWFGEQLPALTLQRAYSAAAEADVFLAVGTSAVINPAAELPHIAKANGAYLIEINPEKTVISDMADCNIHRNAAAALPDLYQHLVKEMSDN